MYGSGTAATTFPGCREVLCYPSWAVLAARMKAYSLAPDFLTLHVSCKWSRVTIHVERPACTYQTHVKKSDHPANENAETKITRS